MRWKSANSLQCKQTSNRHKYVVAYIHIYTHTHTHMYACVHAMTHTKLFVSLKLNWHDST